MVAGDSFELAGGITSHRLNGQVLPSFPAGAGHLCIPPYLLGEEERQIVNYARTGSVSATCFSCNRRIYTSHSKPRAKRVTIGWISPTAARFSRKARSALNQTLRTLERNHHRPHLPKSPRRLISARPFQPSCWSPSNSLHRLRTRR